jgi:adenylate kinase
MGQFLMIGPPGAGKGTQAAKLSKRLDIPAISTGELFREQARNQSVFGRRIASILAAGNYVPDGTTNALVEGRLDDPDAAGGFILDGFPRTAAQVDGLDRILVTLKVSLDAVVHLNASVEELVTRLTKRGTAVGRSDDNPDAIRNRLHVYNEQTKPLLDIYLARGLLVSVDGLGSEDTVHHNVMATLQKSSS